MTEHQQRRNEWLELLTLGIESRAVEPVPVYGHIHQPVQRQELTTEETT